ncbi:MAG: hypothetical protein HKO54_09050, partial [Flavobacteriaceae bacterium]|nr:hypothetical protein [Flavobacteriaceae bacterium]
EFINHFDFYNLAEFEKAYSNYFDLEKKEAIADTERVLFHFRIKNH